MTPANGQDSCAVSSVPRPVQRDVISPSGRSSNGRDDLRGDVGPANGPDAKLHGRGPRAEARAARGALHVRRANARRVTPRGFDVPSRLCRRAEAGPCQLLRRVRRPTARKGVEATCREPFQLWPVPATSSDPEDELLVPEER